MGRFIVAMIANSSPVPIFLRLGRIRVVACIIEVHLVAYLCPLPFKMGKYHQYNYVAVRNILVTFVKKYDSSDYILLPYT